MEALKARLEALVAGGSTTESNPDMAREAGELLLELIRLEARADRLMQAARAQVRDPGAPLQGLRLHDAALTVLRDAGQPLHAREISAQMRAGGWSHPRTRRAPPEQLVHQLAARLPRHSNLFRRVAPNTFALVEWSDGHQRAVREQPSALFRGAPGDLARWIGDHPEAPFEETWPSS